MNLASSTDEAHRAVLTKAVRELGCNALDRVSARPRKRCVRSSPRTSTVTTATARRASELIDLDRAAFGYDVAARDGRAERVHVAVRRTRS
jgi:hypothetical protein